MQFTRDQLIGEQLERVIQTMQWFNDDVQDFGTKDENWNGSFEYWTVANKSILNSLASPYYYQ